MKLAACLALAACGWGSRASPATTTPPAHEVLPDVAFGDLDRGQKLEVMKQKVMVAMATAFRTHDGNRFARFDCATCHGPGAAQDRFDMPNPQLPRLVRHELSAGTSQFKAEDIRWMTDEITPAMADLLRLPRSSPATPNGFGCDACHRVDE